MRRDFTYIDDVAEAVVKLLDCPATPNPAWQSDTPDPATSDAPWRVYNIGNNAPIDLTRLVLAIETATGKQAMRIPEPMQAGDVPETYADIGDLAALIGFKPSTPIEDGIARFVEWFQSYKRL
jgi:UDP-glucuronate 4-epimerase